jgi:2-desacetyl-2-hydroxyethyl bacteriochlorophyllide A dehydrogenase
LILLKVKGGVNMKGIICVEPNQLENRELDYPIKKAGEAIIKIKRIGVCGTDIHAYKGRQPFFTYPRILGHELAGFIEEIEENGHGFEIGDQVSVIPYMECGKCIACRNGKGNCCTSMKVIGVHADGGMCEYISVPIDHLVKTNNLTLDQTAVIEPLSISAHAVRRADVKKDEWVLVIGAGPIGLGLMSIAKQHGAKVIAMDINDDRLTFCEKWAKVDKTINALENPLESLSEMTQGDFPTIVFDATGSQQSMNQAIEYVAHGGKLVYVGLTKNDIIFPHPKFHSKEMTLMGSRNATMDDFQYVIENLENGGIDIEEYVTHRCTFDQFTACFEEWLSPDSEIIKGVIEL